MGLLRLVWETSFLTKFILLQILTWSTLLAVVIFTRPKPFEAEDVQSLTEDEFSDQDRNNATSGYAYFNKQQQGQKAVRPATTVVVLVLGDIGRSPRMQYHAVSIAAHGGRVDLVGYVESEVLPEIRASKLIRIIPLEPLPLQLQTTSKAMFPIIAPLKVLFQIWNLYMALGYKTRPNKFMLVQNPPSIPTLLIAQIMCFLRGTRLIIDWHNLGHTILALKLGYKHPLVKLSEQYETVVARYANGHFAVSQAMAKLLKNRYSIDALPLYDRPAKQFQPISIQARSQFLARLPETAKHAQQIEKGERRLLVSSTSWTPDEDFSILLDALVAYSATASMDKQYPKILAIITGKGPLKRHYVERINRLHREKKLSHAHISTAWLSIEDYATLLGSADLGVSLHTSSSGVDLPMKVVDMFGTGLPVVGWDKFEAWPELVQEGVNGRGFHNAEGLDRLLLELLGNGGHKMEDLRRGALMESKRRWEDEWTTAAKVFGIQPDE